MKRQAWKRMQAWLLVVAMLVSVVTGIGTTKTAKAATKMGVTYTVHVQTYGDQQGWVHDGTMAGTKGQAKRLEEIRVKLTGDEYSGSIQYKTHIQSYGWQDWSYNGEKSGSRGQAKRLEGIEIQLTGEVAKHYDVVYRVHCQTYGWMSWLTDGKTSGTTGEGKRLEAIEVKLTGNRYYGGISYRTHVQTYGWETKMVSNGAMSGTSGQAKRLEAIELELYGEVAYYYDVYYRVHAQSYGWLGWAKNGAPAGTAGYAKRLEGIQIVVVKRGMPAPEVDYAGVYASATVRQTASYIAKNGTSPVLGSSATTNANPTVSGENTVNVAYRTHVQTYGWQGWKYNGQMSGTSGQAKRLEGICIKLTNKPYSGNIVYTTHVQTYGWEGNINDVSTWKQNGVMSGTSGRAKRLEAICINLTGEMAAQYDVYYRVHAQTYGWLGWSKNGAPAGTAGMAKRLEGIQIVLVPKNGAAPSVNYQGIRSVQSRSYIQR